MRRRTVLAGCACCLSAVAGCLSTEPAPTADEGDRHMFAEATIGVRIDVDSETDHDLDRNAREALAWWEEHSREYVDFGVSFELVDSDPDIVIAYADDPRGCENVEGYSERVLGCAPLIRPGRRARRPVTARVVAGHRPFGKIRVTTKHELGHIFGLGHDDEPAWIMSSRPEDRIPLYDVRIAIWEALNEAQTSGNAATSSFNDGVGAWREGDFERADGRFLASHEAYGEMRDLLVRIQEQAGEFDGHERVETVNLPRLRELLSQLYRRTSASEWFAWHMAEAARAALEADDAGVETALAAANERIREYNEVGPTEMRDVAIALGLVRGFDRDDEVLEPEEDELADSAT